jgi:uncharacterized protein (DUF983 family)
VTKEAQNMPPAIVVALWRGLRQRCPRCGHGRILKGYITPVRACPSCGEDLRRFQTADFAPYLVVFAIGLIFTPLTLAVSLNASAWSGAIIAIMIAAAALALILLPRAKGAAIALLWALDVDSNQ